jgi:hypothetical protein
MGDPALSPREIRAAAEVHGELSPEYRDAVVESFLEKIDKEIGARVDARLARTPPPDQGQDLLARKREQLRAMVAGSVIAALASGAAVEWSLEYPGSSAFKALAVVWLVLAVAYLGYARHLRRR